MNLLVCGDFDTLAVYVEDPVYQKKISEIKTEIANKLCVPDREIKLRFGDNLLPEDAQLLTAISRGLRSGAAILVVANPLRIKLQRYCSNIDLDLEISRLAFKRWSTDTLFCFCLYKAGLPYRKDGKYVFAVEGTVIQPGTNIADYSCFKDDFTITVSFIQLVECCDPLDINDARPIHIPSNVRSTQLDKILVATCEQKLSQHSPRYDERYAQGIFSGSLNCEQNQIRSRFNRWKLFIKMIDGSKQEVELDNHCLTTVHELRMRFLSPFLNIRLTIGSTILEDWDEEGNLMLLCCYPDIHDGATLYQVNLTGAIRVKYREKHKVQRLMLHDQLECKLKENFPVTIPSFIYIEDPKCFTAERLCKILIRCAVTSSNNHHHLISKPNDPLSSFDFIHDNCYIDY